jgi:hypothetical protein
MGATGCTVRLPVKATLAQTPGVHRPCIYRRGRREETFKGTGKGPRSHTQMDEEKLPSSHPHSSALSNN